MARLSWNRYGKSRVRLVKVRRPRGTMTTGAPGVNDVPHEIVDLTIDVQLEGAFERVYVDGDNSQCVATDTMKNTVYAFARQEAIDHVELFANRLAAHFLETPAVSRVRISAVEHRWDRVSVDGRPHPHAFAQPGGEQWTAVVSRDARSTTIVSGVTNLVVLKTTDSAFSGFPRDHFTTLAETEDRILATSVTASWTYRPGTTDFAARDRIRRALVETFAAHQSRSVQQTLYAMGEAALAACSDVTDITLELPNRHHVLVDLKPFGLDNPNEIFVATDQPFGLIEATIRRSRP
ncbi:MAG: urate oxidase [Acidobacteria bacterium]|nr:urate oxidase [Acidobacteriota bacterium]